MANERNRRGEGSITQRADGRFMVRVPVPGAPGKKKTVYTLNHQAAVRELQKLRESILDPEPTKMAVSIFFNKWLEDVVKPTRRETTYANYKYIVESFILPTLGLVKLSKLKRSMVNEFLANLKASAGPASPRMKHLVRAVMRKAFNVAIDWELISSNPAEKVTVPAIPHKEMKTWDADQVRRFLDFLEIAYDEPNWRGRGDQIPFALWELLAASGMRLGEALGLQWADVDFENGRVTVNWTLIEIAQKIRGLGPVKTKAGKRIVTLPPRTMAALKAQRSRAPVGLPIVFPNGINGYFLQGTIRRGFKRIVAKYNERQKDAAQHLPLIRIHDFRHTQATLLLSQGVNPKVVQERLGHANIQTTLGTYTHVPDAVARDAANKVGELLGE